MQRRDFIKGALLSSAVLAASAGEIFAEGSVAGGMDINRLQNTENPSSLEQKHVPAVTAPASVKPGAWFGINVKVGFMQEHPSTEGHWITMIKILVDGKDVAVTDFKSGGISAPDVTFRIKIDRASTIEAVEHCNLHGTWISQPLSIKVS